MSADLNDPMLRDPLSSSGLAVGGLKNGSLVGVVGDLPSEAESSGIGFGAGSSSSWPGARLVTTSPTITTTKPPRKPIPLLRSKVANSWKKKPQRQTCMMQPLPRKSGMAIKACRKYAEATW
eukprot:CAMPEP_0172696408 /NCGR_PEP_ID=MMETSP1074-20121228/28030_1 /TAXON_ID=2916 /ORGANISM="Ceratium fusus, Strain PA161109" /LENGTH=121 /DNA_ID=CAMNT_0013517151 /DNA_START=170 /DNA_END=532 /DNA_ORIENTATION=+